MRAGMSTVQQTLTAEASGVMKQAVTEAHRRGHAQVTPLHVAATLLTAPGSMLRQACLQSHLHLPHPLQCRALELCFNVALDRLPTTQISSQISSPNNPSLSNALVAALKRAQAHQRRGCPEQQQVPLLAVKVEMEQLIISILDDPSVSRVMREAGFSSTHVKSSLEDHPSPFQNRPSISLPNADQSRLKFSSPDHIGLKLSLFKPLNHPGYGGFQSDNVLLSLGRHDSPVFGSRAPNFGSEIDSLYSTDLKNVIQILLRRKNRNPVLIGDSSLNSNALIKEMMQRIEKNDIVDELKGVRFISPNLQGLVTRAHSKEEVDMKISELRRSIEEHLRGGVMIFLGDLHWLADQPSQQSENYFSPARYGLMELGKLLMCAANSGRLWIIATSSSQTYMRFQLRHPSLETHWGLQPLPISMGLPSRLGNQDIRLNGVDPCNPVTPGLLSKLPFKLLISGDEDSDTLSCCSECTAKFEHECTILQERGRISNTESVHSCSTSIDLSNKAEESTSMQLPAWLQGNKDATDLKERRLLQMKGQHNQSLQILWDLRRKWNQTCRSLHRGKRVSALSDILHEPASSSSQASSATATNPRSHTRDDQLGQESQKTDNSISFPPQSSWLSLQPQQPQESQKSIHDVLKVGDPTCSSRLEGGLSSMNRSMFSLACSSPQMPGCTTSSQDARLRMAITANRTEQLDSGLTVQTDLVLGRSGVNQPCNSRAELDNSVNGGKCHAERIEDTAGCTPMLNSFFPIKSQNCMPSSLNPPDRVLQKNSFATGPERRELLQFKSLLKSLEERVPWQPDAVTSLSSIVTQCRSGMCRQRGVNLKSDIWLLFLGPDRIGKRKLAKALSELVFGSDNFVSLNVKATEDDVNKRSFRGRTNLDIILDAVRSKPYAVLLLEDLDQADATLKRGLLRAMETGKLCDSHGREVSFANVIVIVTSSLEPNCSSSKASTLLVEERLATIQGREMRLLMEQIDEDFAHIDDAGLVSVVEYKSYHQVEKLITVPQVQASPGKKRKAKWAELLSSFWEKRSRGHDELSLGLDLNLPVDDNARSLLETCQAGSPKSKEYIIAQILGDSGAAELFDESIMFQPFDFDEVSERVLETISDMATKAVSMSTLVEIDVNVLEHIVASIWEEDYGTENFDRWINEAFADAIAQMAPRFRSSANKLIIRLIPDKGSTMPTRVQLPRRIKMGTDE